MIIRKLIPSDACGFREMRLLATRLEPVALSPTAAEEAALPLDVFERRLAANSNAGVFGAFDGERLIGIISMRQEADLKRAHLCQVFGLFVVPESRRVGIGTKLLKEVVDYAFRVPQFRRLRAFVNADNCALQLLLANGFVAYGLEPDAIAVGDRFFDACHLSLLLRA
jgi:RimJ/RimL family protein N-acetyltransferase